MHKTAPNTPPLGWGMVARLLLRSAPPKIARGDRILRSCERGSYVPKSSHESSLYQNNRQPYGSLSNVLRKPAGKDLRKDGSRWSWICRHIQFHELERRNAQCPVPRTRGPVIAARTRQLAQPQPLSAEMREMGPRQRARSAGPHTSPDHAHTRH